MTAILKLQASDIGLQIDPESWAVSELLSQSSDNPSGSIIVQIYQELRRIERRVIEDPIRQRIYAVALFDFHRWINSNIKYVTDDDVEKIAQKLPESRNTPNSLEEVTGMIRLYVKYGRRMKTVADRNGGLGALLVIPSDGITLRQ